MSVAPAQCYLTQYMACFKQLGHFELHRDRMLYHFSETPQQQQSTREMSEDDFQEENAAALLMNSLNLQHKYITSVLQLND